MDVWSHIPCHKFDTSNTQSSVCWNKYKIDFGGSFKTYLGSFLAHFSSEMLWHTQFHIFGKLLLSQPNKLSNHGIIYLTGKQEIVGNFQGEKPQMHCPSKSQIGKLLCMLKFLKDMQNFHSLRHCNTHSCIKPGHQKAV